MTDHNLGKWVHNFEGQGQIFEIEGRTVAMFRIDGKLYAFDDMCPHIDGSLGKGKLDGKLVTCPLHDRVLSGACIVRSRLDPVL